MDNLPEHVFVENILFLLPVKSLVCMRSVCKSWRSRILNPDFIELHMAKTMADPYSDNLIAHDRWGHDNQLSVVNTNFLDKGVSCLDFPSNLPKPCYVVGSCNGLLCVACEQSRQILKELYIWNPATREVKHVHEHTYINIYKMSNINQGSLGFCFDISSSDYKVVRIVTEHRFAPVMSRVEVYSLIKNYWKEIKVDDFEVESNCPAIVKGSIYWIVKHGLVYRRPSALLSFDVKSENFCTISLPDSIMSHKYSSDIELLEFKESVALILGNSTNEDITIWTLDDDSCWIMKFTIALRPSPIRKIVGCLKTGEFVGKDCDELLVYNPVNNVVKQTQLKMVTPRIYSYSESLVNLSSPSRSTPIAREG
ncbi:F-box domain-containing protein [Heracleum sosnowskyi]|uniref:F-box domain-containing protein n=1 Tax=Heracleum sosnowskyi TaxID=360622 RepID=A0AAD8JAX9_9APIA|nr:F-box domain-containing protein [Heracleum sosnowskyi]